jgi:hypothetical protein
MERGELSKGDMHEEKAVLSMSQAKLALGSSDENVKTGVRAPVAPEGPESIVVSGAVESSTYVREIVEHVEVRAVFGSVAVA